MLFLYFTEDIVVIVYSPETRGPQLSGPFSFGIHPVTYTGEMAFI